MRRALSALAALGLQRELRDVASAARACSYLPQRLPTALVQRRWGPRGSGGAEGGEGAMGVHWSPSDGLSADVGGDAEDSRGLGDGDGRGGLVLLPAALQVPEDLANLLPAGGGDDLVRGVHRLAARNRGVIEMPEALDRAVRVAVRDTGHTHRQIKAKGRSLLDSLKSISRGFPSRGDVDDSAVKSWLKDSASESTGSSLRDIGKPLREGVEWGMSIPVRKQRRILEGIRDDAAVAAADGAARGGKAMKGKKKSPTSPREAATSYGPLEAAAYAVTRLPMTFGAQQRVMQELKVRSPGFVPRTLLDFGAGPAPSLWAARRVFGEHFGDMDAAATWGRAGGGSGGGGSGGGRRAGTFSTTTTLVDASPSMMAFTRRLAKVVYDNRDLEDLGSEMGFLSKPSGRPMPEPNPWGDTGPVRTVASLRSLSDRASFDLVVAGYSLGELAVGTRPEQQQALVRGNAGGGAVGGGGGGGGLALGEHVEKTPGQKRVEDTVRTLWSRVSLGGALVLIEPGTPRGSELIRRARAQVLDIERAAADKRARAGKADGGGDDSVSLVSSSAGMEAHVVAPCQHDRTCPMDGLNSWCHFSQRVVRSAMHRQMLPRGRGPQHQDERFSYVVIRRLSREGATAEATARATRIASGGGDYFGDEDGERDADRDGEAEGSTFRDEDDDEEEREERRRIRMSIRGSDQNRNSAENDEEDEAEAAMQSGEHEGEDGNEDEDEDKDEDNSESLAAAMAVASSHEWGRMVRPPMKKTGHVIIDVCSAEGNLVRHIVAKSSAWEGGVGKSGYKAARKSKWGDLWPYRDPRAVNELDDDDRQLHLEAFFKDFEGVNMDQVDGSGPGVATPAKAQRSTPIGVGGARKPFMKRPKIVEKYVEMERAGQNVEDIEGVG